VARSNVEHSFRDRRSETNPDFDAVSYATAQQWTDEFLKNSTVLP
jgi:hypothetical protein